MQTVLLGEAPKRRDGFAFDEASWTTQQISGVLGMDPADLNKAFFVINVFERPQRRTRRGFDRFSIEWAADEINDIHFPCQRIVCLGSRVAAAMELALDLDERAIPENRFRRFNDTTRGGGWELARVPHPSGCRDAVAADGFVLPRETRAFLRNAASTCMYHPLRSWR